MSTGLALVLLFGLGQLLFLSRLLRGFLLLFARVVGFHGRVFVGEGCVACVLGLAGARINDDDAHSSLFPAVRYEDRMGLPPCMGMSFGSDDAHIEPGLC